MMTLPICSRILDDLIDEYNLRELIICRSMTDFGIHTYLKHPIVSDCIFEIIVSGEKYKINCVIQMVHNGIAYRTTQAIDLYFITESGVANHFDRWVRWFKTICSYDFNMYNKCLISNTHTNIVDLLNDIDGLYSLSEIFYVDNNLTFNISLVDCKYSVEVTSLTTSYVVRIVIGKGVIFSEIIDNLNMNKLLNALFSVKQVREAKLKQLML
jgi:hypothetical protein